MVELKVYCSLKAAFGIVNAAFARVNAALGVVKALLLDYNTKVRNSETATNVNSRVFTSTHVFCRIKLRLT